MACPTATVQRPCSSFKSLQSSEKIPLFQTEYKFCDLGLIKNIATCILKYTTISYVIYDWGGSRPLRPLVNKISNFSLIKNLQNKNFVNKTKTPFKVFYYTSMVRYTLQRILMIPLYPAQSLLFREIFSPQSRLRSNDLDIKRAEIIASNNLEGFLYKEISIRKNGIEYNGIMAYRPQYLENGNWVLQATGNAEPIEYSIENVSRIYDAIEFNTLMINGPYVGKSNGEATPDSMGDAQEAGLCYLERVVKANNIVIAGRSLGGAAIGQAILKHNFRQDKKYIVVRQMSFDRVSNLCAKFIGCSEKSIFDIFIKNIVKFCGCEINSIDASKKLQSLRIRELIVQDTKKIFRGNELPDLSDFKDNFPIPREASLGHALIKSGITENKGFYGLMNVHHMTNESISCVKAEIENTFGK